MKTGILAICTGTINTIFYQECLGPRGFLTKELCSVHSYVPKVKGHLYILFVLQKWFMVEE